MIVSPPIQKEIADTPEMVQDLFDEILSRHSILITVSPEAIELQERYIAQKILTPKWEDDALHVALATVNACRVIVSWNFKHIVNYAKIPLYNAVNQVNGYHLIAIHSPLEMMCDE